MVTTDIHSIVRSHMFVPLGRHYLEHNGTLVNYDTLLRIQRIVDEMNNSSYYKHNNQYNQYTHNTTSKSKSTANTVIVSNDDDTMTRETGSTTTNLSSPQLSPQSVTEPTLSVPYKAIPPFVLELSQHGFILKYKWSPWPNNVHKMLIINQKYVEKSLKWDETPGMETHTHEYSTVEALDDRRNKILNSHNLFDLRHVPLMEGNIYAWRTQGTTLFPHTSISHTFLIYSKTHNPIMS